MQAINFVGTSDFSAVMTSFAAVVPSVPKNFTVTDSAAGSVTLAWTEPDDDGGSELIGYFIYFKRTNTVDEWSRSELI